MKYYEIATFVLAENGSAGGLWVSITYSSSSGSPVTTAGNVKLTGSINMSGNRLYNLPEPNFTQDSATKGYVDQKMIGYLTSSVVPYMTSNTIPSPYVASASSEYGTELAYGAFTYNDLHWACAQEVSNCYKFV